MVIWVDQLCVDQNNPEEQSRQVNMMGQVYSRAEQVIMWLGPDPQGYAPIARNFVKEINLRRERPFPGGSYPNGKNLLKDGLPKTSSIKRNAMGHSLQLPYIERVWSIQELMLASYKIFFWGVQS
jgi:hypothetical protein